MLPRFFRSFVNRQRAFRQLERVSILEKEGRTEEALSLCQEVVNQNPHVATFRFQLAMLQKALGHEILPDAAGKFPNSVSKFKP